MWDPYPYFDGSLFDQLQEVHFGRLSSARSPVDVIDHGYLEAINRLNTVQRLEDEYGVVLPDTTDPAGRLHYYAMNAETGETGWYTIDAPLENLGLYDRIMKYGTLLRVEYIRVDSGHVYWKKPLPIGTSTIFPTSWRVSIRVSESPLPVIRMRPATHTGAACDDLLDPTRIRPPDCGVGHCGGGRQNRLLHDRHVHSRQYLSRNQRPRHRDILPVRTGTRCPLRPVRTVRQQAFGAAASDLPRNSGLRGRVEHSRRSPLFLCRRCPGVLCRNVPVDPALHVFRHRLLLRAVGGRGSVDGRDPRGHSRVERI